MNSLPANFDSLSPLEKRAAVELATGLPWAEYEKLPGATKTAILLQLKGHTVQTTAGNMLSASKTDATLNRIGGYVAGLTGAGKLLLFGAAAGMLWLFLPSLKALPGKMRKAVA